MKKETENVEKVWRIDDEGHEYLIPINKTGDFDYLLNEVVNDPNPAIVEESWKRLYKKYKKYRVKGIE